MAEASQGPRARPMSPHLQVWRWHVTMLSSILHRASGVALYVGALIAAAWAVCLATGPRTYLTFQAVIGSWPGRVVMFGLTLAFFYHLGNGIRHLVWDAGHGLDVKTANATAVAAIAFAVVATLATWAAAASMGVF